MPEFFFFFHGFGRIFSLLSEDEFHGILGERSEMKKGKVILDLFLN